MLYIPQGNVIAEQDFCTMICVARSLLLGAPYLPKGLRIEAAKLLYITVAVHRQTRLDNIPLEVCER